MVRRLRAWLRSVLLRWADQLHDPTPIGQWTLDGWDPVAVPRTDHEVRTAAHEAGHVVLAISSKFVTVDSARIDGASEIVDYALGVAQMCRIPGEISLWCWITTVLGGMAAELRRFPNAQSGMSRDDLVVAQGAAQKIARAGWVKPPWGNDTLPGLKGATRFYREGALTPSEVLVFDRAWGRACAVLAREDRLHARLTAALLQHGQLDKAAIDRIVIETKTGA